MTVSYKISRAILLVLLVFGAASSLHAQGGKLTRFSTTHAMFPDTARSGGHDYNGKHFDAAEHYSDSSVLIYVPENYSRKVRLQLVFWFHGWSNSIDSACKQYQLLAQFENSGRNAIFVFPEGPKDAPDSYGGKLEQQHVFQALVKDVVDQLVQEKVIRKSKFSISAVDISLAGHSGAYRVISRIINKTPVKEVLLFDALYGGNDAYLQWLADPAHRFINIYTRNGGTFDNSLLIAKLTADSLKVPVVSVDESAVTPQLLKTHRKIFIFSEQSHNAVITYNRNWQRFLENVPE